MAYDLRLMKHGAGRIKGVLYRTHFIYYKYAKNQTAV